MRSSESSPNSFVHPTCTWPRGSKVGWRSGTASGRVAAHRLWRGKGHPPASLPGWRRQGVGDGCASGAVGAATDGKRVNTELNALRSDPKAREALRLRCEQHLLDMHNEKVHQAEGHGDGTLKNFLAENVKKGAARARLRQRSCLGSPSPRRNVLSGAPAGHPSKCASGRAAPSRLWKAPIGSRVRTRSPAERGGSQQAHQIHPEAIVSDTRRLDRSRTAQDTCGDRWGCCASDERGRRVATSRENSITEFRCVHGLEYVE